LADSTFISSFQEYSGLGNIAWGYALALRLKLLETDSRSGFTWQWAEDVAKTARTLGRHGLADSALAVMRETIPPERQDVLIRTEAWNAYYAGDLVLVDSLAREMEKYPRLAYDGETLRVVLLTLYGRMDEALALAVPPWEWSRTIAMAYFVAGAPERALPYLEEARSRLADSTFVSSFAEYAGLGHIAWGYALAGDVQSARELLAVQDSLVENNNFNPIGLREHIRAVIALQEGRAEDAVEYYRRAKAAHYGNHIYWRTRALLAEAHAELGNFDQAIAQYDTLTGTYRLHSVYRHGYVQMLPLAHERLGSLYLEVGDTVSASRHLGEFIELWKDADPELQPRVEAARLLLERTAAEDS
jgi:tetratricopeptide (TPR) repeat protein